MVFDTIGQFCDNTKHLQTTNQLIDLVVRVFANGLVDRGSIPGQVIPKTQKKKKKKKKKKVLDATLLNTQHHKVYIKGKVEQSRERSSTLPYTLV